MTEGEQPGKNKKLTSTLSDRFFGADVDFGQTDNSPKKSKTPERNDHEEEDQKNQEEEEKKEEERLEELSCLYGDSF